MTASAVWNDWSCRVRLAVTDDDALESARVLLTGLMGDVEQAASRFLPTSDVCRVNRGPGGDEVRVVSAGFAPTARARLR